MDLSLIIPRKYYQMNHLYFRYVKEEKYMYLFDRDDKQFFYTTPMLKVFKNIHEFNNDYYLILNLDNEDDINNDIYNFKSRMDRIYGKAQDEVKRNYKEIFPNLKGYVDQVTYETCVKRPYTGSRGQLMKIKIEEENERMFSKLESVGEGEHIQCNLLYKGLKKINGGRMLEEYILIDFVTEDEWMSEVTKKVMNPYGTKFNVEVVDNQNEIEIQHFENMDNQNIENVNQIINNNENIDEHIEVESIIDNDFILERENDYHKNIEYMESSQNLNIDNEEVKEIKVEEVDKLKEVKKRKVKEDKRKNQEEKKKEKKDKKEKKEKVSREEWLKSKKGKYEENDSDNDNLSDNDDFHSLDEDNKKKFREIMKKMKK